MKVKIIVYQGKSYIITKSLNDKFHLETNRNTTTNYMQAMLIRLISKIEYISQGRVN